MRWCLRESASAAVSVLFRARLNEKIEEEEEEEK